MPNHITNIIKAPASVVTALKTEKSLVDFNSLLPMPAEIGDAKSEGRATSLAKLITGNINLRPKDGDLLGGLELSNVIRDITERGGIKGFKEDADFENFIQLLRNFRTHGAFTWYEWACDHWGTKWNAYDVAKVKGGIKFETAWSAPHPVIANLAEQFPDFAIEHSWADEDIGSNLGHRVYQFGKTTDIEISDPVDFALTLNGDDRKYYRKNVTSGKWEYCET